MASNNKSGDQTLRELYQNDLLPAAVRNGACVQNVEPSLDPVVLQISARCFGRTTGIWAPQNDNPVNTVIPVSGIASQLQTFDRRCPQHPHILPTRHDTSWSNHKGNEGRPYYRCPPCHAQGMNTRSFLGWDDRRGISPNNPTCNCPGGMPSRRQVGCKEYPKKPLRLWYCCANPNEDCGFWQGGTDCYYIG